MVDPSSINTTVDFFCLRVLILLQFSGFLYHLSIVYNCICVATSFSRASTSGLCNEWCCKQELHQLTFNFASHQLLWNLNPGLKDVVHTLESCILWNHLNIIPYILDYFLNFDSSCWTSLPWQLYGLLLPSFAVVSLKNHDERLGHTQFYFQISYFAVVFLGEKKVVSPMYLMAWSFELCSFFHIRYSPDFHKKFVSNIVCFCSTWV